MESPNRGTESAADRKSHVTHGETRDRRATPEYRSWQGMIRRCEDPSSKHYDRYGGRGIRVCERWRKDFTAYLADMGRKPSPQHSLDRYPNNDGNYEPGNCRWATRKEQMRDHARYLKVAGVRRSIEEWSRITGIKVATLNHRARAGWPDEKVLREPVGRWPVKETA